MNLYEFNQKLKIEAKVEFQLNSNGSTIVICMLSLKSGRPYKCIQFRNTNITIFISDNLGFESCGIYPYNENIFREEDFIPSSNDERSFILGESSGHPPSNSSIILIPSSSTNSLPNTFSTIPSPSTNISIKDTIPSNNTLPDPSFTPISISSDVSCEPLGDEEMDNNYIKFC
ncbi:unnamed protein product [Gordionus sp. m RMFG-2023]